MAQQAVLESSSIEVKAHLVKAEYQSTVLRDGLATQKKAMNNLLGCDVKTKFRVSEAAEPEAYANDLEAAERQALESRSEEISQAVDSGTDGILANDRSNSLSVIPEN